MSEAERMKLSKLVRHVGGEEAPAPDAPIDCSWCDRPIREAYERIMNRYAIHPSCFIPAAHAWERMRCDCCGKVHPPKGIIRMPEPGDRVKGDRVTV